MSITAQDIGMIDHIFDNNNWDKSSLEYSEVYESTVQILDRLDQDEKELFINLLKSFNKYGFGVYQKMMLDTIELIPEEDIRQYSKIIFVPIKFPLDSIKSKSGDLLPYMIRTTVAPSWECCQGKDLSFLQSPIEIPCGDIGDGTLLIALDDFIGSGKTAYKFYKSLKDKIGLRAENIIFISLVCMNKGKGYIESKGLRVYSSVIENRGIVDNPAFSCNQTAWDILKNITNRLDISNSYYRGYNRSEALVSMLNTPNNTFPIFWVKHTKNGEDWPAPFKRVE